VLTDNAAEHFCNTVAPPEHIALKVNPIKTAQEEVVEFLKEHPEKALGPDNPAKAMLLRGLQCRVTGQRLNIIMDMSKSVGGGEKGPSPGTMLRAADAGCLAIVIAMKAATEEVKLDHLEVTAQSQSDDRGLFGIGNFPAGPLSSDVTVKISGEASRDKLLEIVHWAEAHSPVSDAIRRSIPSKTEVEIL